MITLPIYWTNIKVRTKSTTHLVGENFFRNAHFHVKNKMKKDYTELVAAQKDNLSPLERPFEVTYVVYYKNPSMDASNVASKIEKFYLDALQHIGIIPEDNVKYHKKSTWIVGGQDKDNPRLEIFIKEFENDQAYNKHLSDTLRYLQNSSLGH